MSRLWLDAMESLNIGLKEIQNYVSEGRWSEAGEFLEMVLTVDEQSTSDYLSRIVDEWNSWIRKFIDNDKLEIIANHVPFMPIYHEDHSIDTEYYNQILNYYMDKNEFTKVITLIDTWDHSLFDVNDIKLRISDELKSYDEKHYQGDSDEIDMKLRELYIDLCLELDEPQLCVDHLIKLDDSTTIQFLDEHHLIPSFLPLLPRILLIGVNKKDVEDVNIPNLRDQLSIGISIIVENSHEVLPKNIIDVMDTNGEDYISYLYLEELSKVDKLLVKDFEDEMVKLYASYSRDSLLSFLNKHNNYSIEKAINVCEEKECISELVYLLSKVGKNKEALILIIDKLNDPERAIRFTNSLDDKELWDFLLDYSMNKPDSIRALMVASGDLIDPIPVISRIPKGVEIPELKQALIKITRNIELDDFIHKIILKIISDETMGLLDKYTSLRLLGYTFEPNSHEKMGEETIIKLTDSTKPLVTEGEMLGKSNVWNRPIASTSDKITHVSFIKKQLLSLSAAGS
ncbi:unnamed protein product [Ambrosiozyma monospora]|uniref:Unnamed protein product n=1 Tax=Ambrosiozyma monospora TaxID=43982 RepID=A0A9W7DHM8_AMBMO|nr:unnamed protein product [Ambrosiozyma monospora]